MQNTNSLKSNSSRDWGSGSVEPRLSVLCPQLYPGPGPHPPPSSLPEHCGLQSPPETRQCLEGSPSDHSGTGVVFAAVGISAAAAVSFPQGTPRWQRPGWHGADRCGFSADLGSTVPFHGHSLVLNASKLGSWQVYKENTSVYCYCSGVAVPALWTQCRDCSPERF